MPWVDDLVALEPVARRAPSVLNTQPVVLRRAVDRLEVGWDPRRTLPILDPDGDQLFLSLGAFIEALRMAAGDAGIGVSVEYAVDVARHRFASLRPGPVTRPSFSADEVRNRVSGAGRFAEPFPSLHEIDQVATSAGLPTGMSVLAWEPAVAAPLAERAHRWLFGTPEPRRELRDWVRPGADDGIEPEALGLPAWRARLFLASRGVWDDAASDLLGGHPRGLGTLAAVLDADPAGGPRRLGVLGAGLLRLILQAARHGLRVQQLPHLSACPETRALLDYLVETSPGAGRVACAVRVGTPEREPPLGRRRPTPIEG